jgi:acyl carrier protein
VSSQEVYELLTGIMRKVFKDQTLVARPEITAQDVKGWDSLAHIRLVLEIERGFKVKFSTSEIAKFRNIGELAEMVEKKLVW